MASGDYNMTRGSTGYTTSDSMSRTHKHLNAERGAKHARRLTKVSSQGAQPPTPSSGSLKKGGIDESHKVRMNTQPDGEVVLTSNPNSIRRKAGSGTRVEQHHQQQSSISQLVMNNKAVSSGIANITVNGSKHSFVKANVPAKRAPQTNKPLNDISGILLANQKAGGGGGGHVRQIRDLGSNPGSRERV